MLNANNDKIDSIDSIETYGYEASKDLVCKKQENECSKIIKQYILILITLQKKA